MLEKQKKKLEAVLSHGVLIFSRPRLCLSRGQAEIEDLKCSKNLPGESSELRGKMAEADYRLHEIMRWWLQHIPHCFGRAGAPVGLGRL